MPSSSGVYELGDLIDDIRELGAEWVERKKSHANDELEKNLMIAAALAKFPITVRRNLNAQEQGTAINNFKSQPLIEQETQALIFLHDLLSYDENDAQPVSDLLKINLQRILKKYEPFNLLGINVKDYDDVAVFLQRALEARAQVRIISMEIFRFIDPAQKDVLTPPPRDSQRSKTRMFFPDPVKLSQISLNNVAEKIKSGKIHGLFGANALHMVFGGIPPALTDLSVKFDGTVLIENNNCLLDENSSQPLDPDDIDSLYQLSGTNLRFDQNQKFRDEVNINFLKMLVLTGSAIETLVNQFEEIHSELTEEILFKIAERIDFARDAILENPDFIEYLNNSATPAVMKKILEEINEFKIFNNPIQWPKEMQTQMQSRFKELKNYALLRGQCSPTQATQMTVEGWHRNSISSVTDSLSELLKSVRGKTPKVTHPKLNPAANLKSKTLSLSESDSPPAPTQEKKSTQLPRISTQTLFSTPDKNTVTKKKTESTILPKIKPRGGR